jgi:hypothetical protein
LVNRKESAIGYDWVCTERVHEGLTTYIVLQNGARLKRIGCGVQEILAHSVSGASPDSGRKSVLI